MSRSFLHSINKLLRPCLINLVGIHKLRDNHNDFKCKILVDESSSSNNQVTEIQNENPLSHKRRWIQHYDKIYDNLSSIDTTNYDGNYEFDENFTHRPDFQKKLLAILNEDYVVKDPGSESESDCSNRSGEGPYNEFYIALAVSINGKMVLKKAYRYQDRENLVPAKEDMVGEIGSITKTLTAMMIMKLIKEEEEALSESENSPVHKRQRGSESDEESTCESDEVSRITLDSYVEDILTPDVWPEHFVEGETDGQKYKITIKQLLQHYSGLEPEGSSESDRSSDFSDCLVNKSRNDNEGSLLESINNVKSNNLIFPPGEQFAYSNYGYQLLALVYEKRTGRSFVEDLRDELAKMGLYDTDFNYREYLALDRARGYLYNSPRDSARSSSSEDDKRSEERLRSEDGSTEDELFPERVNYIDITWHEADYGLVSTVSDVVKYGNIFASCLLNKSNLHTSPLSTNQATEMVEKNQHIGSDFDRTWSKWLKQYHQGLGWQITYVAPLDLESPNENEVLTDFAIAVYEHGGSTDVNQSQLCVFKESGCKTQSHKVLQKRPLMYPLGEDFESEQDIVVGGIIIERLENQEIKSLLMKIMNLVRYEYLRDT